MKKYLFSFIVFTLALFAVNTVFEFNADPFQDDVQYVDTLDQDGPQIYFASVMQDAEPTPTWLIIVNLALGVIVVVAGSAYGIAKGKLGKALALLDTVVKAIEDNKLSTAEIDAIVKAAKDLVAKE